MEFKNLDIVDVEMFGYSQPKKDCWYNLLAKAKDFSAVDAAKFQKSLSTNVEAAYYRLAGITVKDLDTDIEYYLSFIQAKGLWDVEIAGSKAAEIGLEEKSTFFMAPDVKKMIARSHEILDRAYKLYVDAVKEHVEAGELLDVDETKLEAIEHWLSRPQLMQNLKKGLFIK